MIPCFLVSALGWLLNLYILLMLLYALVSWVPNIRGRWSEIVASLVEPVLLPVRRIIPPLGGLDWSFLIVVFILQLAVQAVGRQPCAI